MKKMFLMMLAASFCLVQSNTRAEEDLLAVNTNFGPARPSTEVSPTPPPPVQPATSSAVQPVAPKAGATADTPTAPTNPEANQTLQDELLRRQELLVAGRHLIEQGLKLYYSEKYADAVQKLEQGVKMLPRAKATEIDYTRGLHGLTDGYYQMALQAYQSNDFEKAKQYSQKSLQYGPNGPAEKLIIKVKKAEVAAKNPVLPPMPAPSRDPELTVKKTEITKLFREGKIFYQSGRYDEAEKRFKQVLAIDPYNDDAYTFLGRLNDTRKDSAAYDADQIRNQRLWEVTKSWLPPINRDFKLPEAGTPTDPMGKTSGNTQPITEKLNKLIFPDINFHEASISDVITFLSEESRRLDKADGGKGINIVLGAGVASASTPAAAPAAPVAPSTDIAPATPAAPVSSGGIRPVTLSLKNVPMIEALKYVTSLANLKYRIEPNAIVIVPIDSPDQAMVLRTYSVSPGAFQHTMTAPAESTAPTDIGGGGGGMAAGAVGAPDVKKLFSEAGVPFPAGSSLFYSDKTSTIIVRNTPENIEIFERVLASFNVVPTQVEIEAKFIEISQADLDELGFSWNVGNRTLGGFQMNAGPPSTDFTTGLANANANDSITSGLRDSYSLQGNAVEALLASSGTSGTTPVQVANQLATIKSVLTNPQFQVLIKALSQKKSADVLSAPRITTVSGNQAQIRVVQEFIYPSEYSQPSAGGNVITPTIPSGFKTREIGVLLNVTPTVGADGYTINLTLIPEVSDFLGFLDYSPGTVKQTSNNNNSGGISGSSSNNVGQEIPYKVVQPLFVSRNLTTSIVIWDGQTVMLGGLMREDTQKVDDKVPFLGDVPILGRLFRSKVTMRTKRNLLIFVTARLINPAGNPIHPNTL